MSERDEFKAMFEDAVRDMSAIDEALGIDPDEAGGAEPILSAIEDLKAERDALRADAERYRHMRTSFARDIKHRLTWYLPALTPMTADGLDSAIDAAIAAKEQS